MKERKIFQSEPNFLTVYILGALLFIALALSGYKIWLRYQEIESPASQTITQSITTHSNQSLNLEKELLDNNSMHPEFIINEGDTLGSLLEEAGINKTESTALIDAFSKKFNPRKLNIGTVIELNFEKDSLNKQILNNMLVSITNNKKIEISRSINGEFKAVEVLTPLLKQVDRKVGTIKNSFISTALELSIPANAIMGMIRAFSYDVDFQRDIKRGDKLEVIMDKFYTKDGKLSHAGDILYSSLTLKDRKISIYQFVHADGQVGYYNEKGESIKKEFLRTPINAARISSKFGMRQHPVHGYSKMHRGIDFAAPVGTPILAAGGGTVETVNNHYGGYGKYIRIKHNSTYSTVYAHASRFASGIRPGKKVVQGQVIAYVGTTGVSTGPHLHYEVVEHGKQINPLKFKFASNSEKLTGKSLEQFKQNKKKLEKYSVS